MNCFVAKYKVHPRVHKNFFSGSPEDGTPSTNESAFLDIESEIKSARWHLHAVIQDTNPMLTFDLYLANLCSAIYHLSFKLGLPEIYVTLAEKSTLVPVNIPNEGSKELLTIGKSTDEIVAAYRYTRGYYENLCDFAGRESIKFDTDQEYIDFGDAYKSSTVIERLHETIIKGLVSQGTA